MLMPKRKRPEHDPAQYQRFLDTARELGCDESGEAYERALGIILPPHKPGEIVPPKPKRPEHKRRGVKEPSRNE